jgi:GcrA cell cycle regulator
MSGMRGSERFEWTPAAEAWLEQLWTQADPVLSTGLIGQMMGIGKNAVVGKAYRMGLPARPSPIATLKNPDGTPVPRKVVAKRVAKAPGALVTLPSLAQPLPLVRAAVPARPVVVRRGPATPCCYPIGEPRTREFRTCDAPVRIVGRSYCEEHHALCWVQRAERSSAQLDADMARSLKAAARNEPRLRLGLGWGR